ncbi:hypothetical protein O7623_20265 [Solwaraspora sp. WMMD791]|nr:hypothetical protein [Solwaraspora sp. WMMD791]WFE25696.1 hypothetical protein O7623_20265 [Solwaraspora sp. WMMD791]
MRQPQEAYAADGEHRADPAQRRRRLRYYADHRSEIDEWIAATEDDAA